MRNRACKLLGKVQEANANDEHSFMFLGTVLFLRLDMSFVLIKSRRIRHVLLSDHVVWQAIEYKIRHNSCPSLPLLTFILLFLHSTFDLKKVLSLLTSFLLVLFCTRRPQTGMFCEKSQMSREERVSRHFARNTSWKSQKSLLHVHMKLVAI